jgi:hypothetical protein
MWRLRESFLGGLSLGRPAVGDRLDVDVKAGASLAKPGADEARDAIHGGVHVLGVHLLEFDREGEVEEKAVVAGWGSGLLRQRRAAKHLADVEERAAAADGTFIESAAGDTLAVDAQDGSLQGNGVRRWIFAGYKMQHKYRRWQN